LREAIQAANSHPGPEIIRFAIPAGDTGCGTGGVCEIRPAGTGLPPLTGDGTVIDGFTQPGASANFNPVGLPIAASPKILLTGASVARPSTGILITGDETTLRGLCLGGFSRQIVVQGGEENVIEGNFIGTTPDGVLAYSGQDYGVVLEEGATGTEVGGDAPGSRNLISGHQVGVLIKGANSNHVWGNYIGTTVRGDGILRNSSAGVLISHSGSNNLIGVTAGIGGNLIAFGSGDGVRVDGSGGDTRAASNTIRGNSVHSNHGKAIALVNWGNGYILPPLISQVTYTIASGYTCADCTVEVFSDAEDEGAIYEGVAVADHAGRWTLTRPVGFTGPNLTATATNLTGSTSEFSEPTTLP
jgi:hypothetical protein